MTTISISLFWLQSSYAIGAILISSGLIWTLSITESLTWKKSVSIIFITLLISVGSFLPNFIVESYNIKYIGNINGNAGWGLILFAIFYLSIAFSILSKLFVSYRKARYEERKRLQTIFFGALVTLLITLISSFILPYFSIFPFKSVDDIGFLIFLIFIAYAITKHRLFNIRVIAVEIVVVALWVTILTRVLIAKSTNEILIELGVLLISIIIGIILIRSVLKEIAQREHIEKLATDLQTLNSTLETKVAEQTIEIRKSYDLEKKARRELEKLNETKDQFIMITQHHLRTPVTTITWSLEAMLKGDYGQVQPELNKALETTKSAARRLTRIVDDFLSITAIKIGTQILDISTASMKPLLTEVLQELKMDIENMNLTLTYPTDDTKWPALPIDRNKMHEVLLIIMENAVRYNIQNGTVRIETDIRDDFFELTVENTGIGIDPNDKEKIFHSLFHRGKEAREAHALGMGVGLSVSRAIVRAHYGSIKIESDGKGMGARVVMMVPMKGN